MGRRTQGQILQSILLVRGFEQGVGSQISGSLLSTNVRLSTPKAGCCLSKPHQCGDAKQNDRLTGMSLKVEGEEGESCPWCYRGEWGCLALKAFYRLHVQEGKLYSVLLFMEWLNYLPFIFIDCDQPYPSGIHPQQLGGSFWQMSP